MPDLKKSLADIDEFPLRDIDMALAYTIYGMWYGSDACQKANHTFEV